MDTVRINITIPRDVVKVLDQYAGSRQRSRFITRAIRRQIQEEQQRELTKALAEGYRAAAGEASAVSAEFEALDLEGWDEY